MVVDHSEEVSKFGWLFYLLEDGTQVGTIHELPHVLSNRIKAISYLIRDRLHELTNLSRFSIE